MAVFVEPAPSRDTAEGAAQQLAPIRRRFPGATIRTLEPTGAIESWQVVVEAPGADEQELKQACVEVLGD